MAYYYEKILGEVNIAPGTIEFYCYNSDLDKLPELPGKLEKMSCSCNKLVELPELPQSLAYLYCDYNRLIALPELPVIIIILHCQNNNIKYLSYHNCQIIKKLYPIDLRIINNPVSNGFYNSSNFRESLTDL